MEAHEQAAVYEDDDGATVYRASALGYCVGALVRARLGVTPSPPPDAMQEKFDEGHAWEQRVIVAGLGVDWTQLQGKELGRYGQVIVDPATGLEQVETNITWGDAAKSGVKVIRCHPDAIVQHGSRYPTVTAGNLERRVVEAKFFGKDLFYECVQGVAKAEKEGRNPLLGLGYARAVQASVEMHSTGLPMLYIIGLKERDSAGELMLGEVWTIEVDEPPLGIMDLKARVLEVEGYAVRGEMPACVVPFDYPCAYWAEHDAPEKVELDDKVLAGLVARWEAMDEEAQSIMGQAGIVKAKILARMEEIGATGGECAGWTVNVITPERGNVSWSSAYKALAKETGKSVNEDKYRGKVGEKHVRLSKVQKMDSGVVDG